MTATPLKGETDPIGTAEGQTGGDDSFLDKIASAARAPASRAVEATKKHFPLRGVRATAPLQSFNPTAVRMRINLRDRYGSNEVESTDQLSDDGSDIAILWRARDNRKGRQSIAVRRESLASQKTGDGQAAGSRSRLSSSTMRVLSGIWRMFTYFPYWDMAYWVGFWFTLGSMIWVANGFMAWLPVAYPGSAAPGQVVYGVGITSFVGVMAFQIGATLSYLEAVNEGCWHGSMMRRLIDGHEGVDDKAMMDVKIRSIVDKLDPRNHHHHHRRHHQANDGGDDGTDAEKLAGLDLCESWENANGWPRSRHGSLFQKRRDAVDMGSAEIGEGAVHELLPFRWWPTWKNLKEHHAYEVGFLAVTTQFIGATIFIITGVVALPGILQSLKPWQENMAYWVPQIIASIGFILGSAFFVLESQEKWWKPEPLILGWWVGAWALAGSIGFELCACLSPAAYHSTKISYQSNLASLWGSICFLISSVLQWYEAVNKNPIEELLDEPGEIKSWQVHPI